MLDKEELALAIMNGHAKDTDEALEAAPFFRLTAEEAGIRLRKMKEIYNINFNGLLTLF